LAQSFLQGVAFHQRGLLREAERIYKAVLKADPNHAQSLQNLGIIRFHQGRPEEGAKLIRKALKIAPDDAEAHYNLAMALQLLKRDQDAVAHYEKALALKPDYVDAHVNLGGALVRLGRNAEAQAQSEKALAHNPRSARLHGNLGFLLFARNQVEAALAHCEEAVRLEPASGQAHAQLATALHALGLPGDAIAHFEKAIALDPQHLRARSSLLFSLNFVADATPERLYAAHTEWAKFIAPATPDARFANRPEPQRRLRVGYVSGDFRAHSVAFFVAPLLAAHDRTRIETYCYADVARPDAITARLAADAEHWINISEWTPAAVVERVRADAIDILVDLAGHTGSRLAVFAHKPAPVQVAWLGYPNTTGLETVDYRITDAIADPPGHGERYYAEELIRLPRCFVCYRALEDAPDVTPLPAAAAGPITFGSFNALAKMTPQVVALWARVLHALPDAQLFLKSRGLEGEATGARILALFAAQGIACERVRMAGFAETTGEHLALYGRVDIGLDTFPYNGTTTTCQALWMGVPVVTLRGDRHATRVGASLLHAVDLDGLVAASPDEYVAAAVGLAHKRARLAALRAGLRERMRRSELCDEAGFAAAMEAAYRAAWERWCRTR
jgi:predicted O-linked N-acetylglucosamine transferase (SPINDLY family)